MGNFNPVKLALEINQAINANEHDTLMKLVESWDKRAADIEHGFLQHVYLVRLYNLRFGTKIDVDNMKTILNEIQIVALKNKDNGK